MSSGWRRGEGSGGGEKLEERTAQGPEKREKKTRAKRNENPTVGRQTKNEKKMGKLG